MAPSLGDLAQSEHEDVRAASIYVLGSIGDQDEQTKSIVIGAALYDESPTVRGYAAGAVWRIGLPLKDTLEAVS
jgi:hypothetical protein